MAEPETQEQKEPVLTPIDRGEGHPHWGQHLTREDVLGLIEKNGGATQGLDLTGAYLRDSYPAGKAPGIDLHCKDLRGIILCHADLQEAKLSNAKLRGAKLRGANLSFANLNGANLEEADLRSSLQDADLQDSDLRKANLLGANLQSANLKGAKLEGADLSGSEHFGAVSLVGIDWGSYKIGAELCRDFAWAQDIYRILRQLHASAGLADPAARFYYREMECQRKAAKQTKNYGNWLWLQALRSLAGYGEKWWRVPIWAIVFIVGFSLVYWWSGLVDDGRFLGSLYFSAVSFTAVGYGGWMRATGWAQTLGVMESFIGIFLNALFLVTFVRNMTR